MIASFLNSLNSGVNNGSNLSANLNNTNVSESVETKKSGLLIGLQDAEGDEKPDFFSLIAQYMQNAQMQNLIQVQDLQALISNLNQIGQEKLFEQFGLKPENLIETFLQKDFTTQKKAGLLELLKANQKVSSDACFDLIENNLENNQISLNLNKKDQKGLIIKEKQNNFSQNGLINNKLENNQEVDATDLCSNNINISQNANGQALAANFNNKTELNKTELKAEIIEKHDLLGGVPIQTNQTNLANLTTKKEENFGESTYKLLEHLKAQKNLLKDSGLENGSLTKLESNYQNISGAYVNNNFDENNLKNSKTQSLFNLYNIQTQGNSQVINKSAYSFFDTNIKKTDELGFNETNSQARKLTDVNIMEQILDKSVVRLREGMSEIKIELRPPDLGNISMHVLNENNQVNVKIIAEMGFVKDIIDSNLSQLKSELERQGLKIDQLNVFISDDSNKQSSYETFENKKFNDIDNKQNAINNISNANNTRDIGDINYLNSNQARVGRINCFI